MIFQEEMRVSKLGHHPVNLCWRSALSKAIQDPKLGMPHKVPREGREGLW